jgi:lysophospholipase L1-like esterase
VTDRRSLPARLIGLGALLLLGLVLASAIVLFRTDGPAASVTTTATPTPSTPTGSTPTPSTPTRSTPSSGSVRPVGPLRLIGFGDSVMAGTGCDCDDFLTQTADQLRSRTGRKVDTVNNSANGETAADVLDELRTDDSYTAEIEQADVIVVTIGANDLGPALDSWEDSGCDRSCYRPQVATMGDRLSAILTLVGRHEKPGAVVLVTNYWNVFEDGDIGSEDYGAGYLSWSDQVTRDANAAICQTARQAAATCVDLYEPFKGADGAHDPTALLADDGDHPDEAGTTLIATLLVTDVRRLLPER